MRCTTNKEGKECSPADRERGHRRLEVVLAKRGKMGNEGGSLTGRGKVNSIVKGKIPEGLDVEFIKGRRAQMNRVGIGGRGDGGGGGGWGPSASVLPVGSRIRGGLGVQRFRAVRRTGGGKRGESLYLHKRLQARKKVGLDQTFQR